MEVNEIPEPTVLTLSDQLTGTIQNFSFACSMVKADSDKVVARKMLLTAIRSMRLMIDVSC